MTLAADDPRHGTYTGYKNQKCRCELCRTANTAACRDRQDTQPSLEAARKARQRASRLPRTLPPEMTALFRKQREELTFRHADEMNALIDRQLKEAEKVHNARRTNNLRAVLEKRVTTAEAKAAELRRLLEDSP